MYKQFNFTYDAAALKSIDLKNEETPRLVKGPYMQLDFAILKEPAVASIMEKFGFIGDYLSHNIGLTRITSSTIPYVSPGNNGLIILPVENPVTVKFYSYRPPIKNGRPYLDPVEVTRNAALSAEVTATYTESVLVDKPTAFNGLKPHSVHVEPGNPALVFIIKIPKEMSWDTVEYALDDLS